MTNITKKDVADVIKDNNKYLEDLMGDTANIILNGVQAMFDKRDVKINQLSKDMNDVKRDAKFIRQDLKDMEGEMSDKPSRKQFETLKSQFDNYPTV